MIQKNSMRQNGVLVLTRARRLQPFFQTRHCISYRDSTRLRILESVWIFTGNTYSTLPLKHTTPLPIYWSQWFSSQNEIECFWESFTSKQIFLYYKHARELLNAVVTDIIHLHSRKLNAYRGSYDNFVKSMAEVHSVLPFSKQNKMFFGYFDPENIFSDNENN